MRLPRLSRTTWSSTTACWNRHCFSRRILPRTVAPDLRSPAKRRGPWRAALLRRRSWTQTCPSKAAARECGPPPQATGLEITGASTRILSGAASVWKTSLRRRSFRSDRASPALAPRRVELGPLRLLLVERSLLLRLLREWSLLHCCCLRSSLFVEWSLLHCCSPQARKAAEQAPLYEKPSADLLDQQPTTNNPQPTTRNPQPATRNPQLTVHPSRCVPCTGSSPSSCLAPEAPPRQWAARSRTVAGSWRRQPHRRWNSPRFDGYE